MPDFIRNIKTQFLYYKELGEKTMSQLSDDELFWQYNATSNSIAIIVNHLRGNMLSRWTDFLQTDGEKPWRERDREFENVFTDRNAILAGWEEGWHCLMKAIESLHPEDLSKTVYIRAQE